MQVTIYRVDSGFRNVPDGLTLREPGSDVLYSSTVYDLPDGYVADVDCYGAMRILDPSGVEATPVLRNNSARSPVLLVTGNGTVALRKAREASETTTLRDARVSAGLTQQQLADASGVNVRQIQRVELGSSDAGNLTARNLLAIADALGIDPHDLI